MFLSPTILSVTAPHPLWIGFFMIGLQWLECLFYGCLVESTCKMKISKGSKAM